MLSTKYRQANDSISVNENRKNELLVLIKNERKETEKRKGRVFRSFVIIAVVVFAFATIVAMGRYSVLINDISESKESNDLVVLNFNTVDSLNIRKNKLPLFTVVGEGKYKREGLPLFLEKALPVLPKKYVKESEFDVVFSEDWKEFFVSSSFGEGDIVILLNAERSSSERKENTNLVVSKLEGSDKKIYLLESREENMFQLFYLSHENILVSIVTCGMKKEEFIELIKDIKIL